jgi:hypothetical protein
MRCSTVNEANVRVAQSGSSVPCGVADGCVDDVGAVGVVFRDAPVDADGDALGADRSHADANEISNTIDASWRGRRVEQLMTFR